MQPTQSQTNKVPVSNDALDGTNIGEPSAPSDEIPAKWRCYSCSGHVWAACIGSLLTLLVCVTLLPFTVSNVRSHTVEVLVEHAEPQVIEKFIEKIVEIEVPVEVPVEVLVEKIIWQEMPVEVLIQDKAWCDAEVDRAIAHSHGVPVAFGPLTCTGGID